MNRTMEVLSVTLILPIIMINILMSEENPSGLNVVYYENI